MKRASRARRGAWVVVALVGATAVSMATADSVRELINSENPIKRGYALVPPGVVLNLQGKDRQLVGYGSYVVNTSACVDCHSHPTYSPGGDPYKGEPERLNAEEYLSGGRQFGPTITAPNITPDREGKPAGLTRREFIQTLRTPATTRKTRPAKSCK